jgi:hypothetical protein
MPSTSALSQPRLTVSPALTDTLADASADSVWAASVRIRLQDYEGGDRSSATESETRYRKLLERSLGGPQALALALDAYSQACEGGEPDDIEAEQRALAEAWVKASHRAHTESLSGLEEAQSAWFEVTAVKAASMVEAPVAPAPVEVYEPPIPMDEVFVAAPVRTPALAQPRALAACEQAPARTRVRSLGKATEPVSQISLF